MRHLLLALAICFASFSAHAANSQQDKMKACSEQAKSQNLAGDQRKTFMSSCLSAKPASAGNAQQEKMKTCNADAKTKGLKGDARKSFMSSCLKGQ